MPKRQRRKDDACVQKRQFLGRYAIARVANRSKVKRVALKNLGELVCEPVWFNSGYIYPLGYCAQVEYKDILDPNIRISYCCQIVNNCGRPWFKVTSPTLETSFVGKSPTACWKQVLDRINETLATKGLPVVRTQVAGPEYFGLNDPAIVEAIEGLDPNKTCEAYWVEKENILHARQVYEARHPKPSRTGRNRQVREEDPDDCLTYAGAWSSIQRKERYRNRMLNQGHAVDVEDDNPMPEYVDPITLQSVVLPALSPYGHVAGYYSWVQALKESSGTCPFTKLPLTIESLIKLTKQNFRKYQSCIIEL